MLDADPHEIRNLAGEPGSGAIIERLGSKMDEWIAETKDTGLDGEEWE